MFTRVHKSVVRRAGKMRVRARTHEERNVFSAAYCVYYTVHTAADESGVEKYNTYIIIYVQCARVFARNKRKRTRYEKT